jgi:hypothetical protein
VHREFVNGLHSGSSDGVQRRSDAFCREAVEVRTRLPEVEHAPTTFYCTGRVKDESIRWIGVRVEHSLCWSNCSTVTPASLMRIPTVMIPPLVRLGGLYARSWSGVGETLVS